MSHFTDDMILSIDNPKTPLKPIRNNIQIQVSYKIESQSTFLYTNNENSDKETFKIPSATATKRIKYLGIN